MSKSPLQIALALGFRHYDDTDTTESERDALLAAMVAEMPAAEAEAASRCLHHRKQARTLQMQLGALLEGIGEKS